MYDLYCMYLYVLTSIGMYRKNDISCNIHCWYSSNELELDFQPTGWSEGKTMDQASMWNISPALPVPGLPTHLYSELGGTGPIRLNFSREIVPNLAKVSITTHSHSTNAQSHSSLCTRTLRLWSWSRPIQTSSLQQRRTLKRTEKTSHHVKM